VSYLREIVILCDWCGLIHETPHSTLDLARNDARLAGWTHKGAEDYCPEHSDA
jgi:hypothetical protein